MLRAITTRLQAKLILAFVLVLLIPTGIIAVYSLNNTYNHDVAAAREAELLNITNEAAQIEALVNRVKSDVLFLSSATVTKNYADAVTAIDPVVTEKALAEMESVFVALSDSVKIYDQVRFIDLRGKEIVNVELHDGKAVILPPALLEDKTGREYFKPSISLPPGGVYISPFDLNQKAGKIEEPHKPVIRFSSPVYDQDGKIRGFTIINLLGKTIQDLVHGDNEAETAYLTDADGNYLATPDQKQLYNRDLSNGFLFQKDHPNDVAQMLAQDTGTLFGSQDRPDQFQTFTHVKLTAEIGSIDWILYHTQPTAGVLSNVYQAQVIVVVIALLSLLFAIGLAVLLTRGIVSPVRQLANAAGTISKGEWDTKVPQVSSQDEIGQLTSAFGSMTRDLRSYYEAQATARIEIERRASELETVAKVSAATSTILNVDDLLQQVADLTKENFHLYHAHIYLLDDRGENLVLAAGAGETGRVMKGRGHSIPANREQSLVARAARTGKGVIINDVRQEPGFLPNPLLPETRSEMAVPLKVGGRVIGVLDTQSEIVNRFDEEDVRVKLSLADQIAVAVENARSFSEITDREQIIEDALRQAETLATFNGSLSRARTEDEILNDLAELAGLYSAGSAAFYFLETDEHNQVLGIRAVAGRTPDGASIPPSAFPKPSMSVGDFPLLNVIFDNPDEPIFVENTATDPLTSQGSYQEIIKAGKIAALIILPLRTGDQWQGMVSFRWSEPQVFSESMRAIFTAIIPTASAVTASRRAAIAQEAALRQAETLAALNGALSRARTADEVLKILANFAGTYNAANAAFYFIETDEKNNVLGLRAAAGYGPDGQAIPLSSFPKQYLGKEEFPLLHVMFETPDEPTFSEDALNSFIDPLGQDARGLEYLRALKMGAFIIIPLKTGDSWQGMISFRWAEPQTFPADMREIFKAIIPTASAVTASRRAAIAQEEARALSDRRASELETVAKVSAATTTILDTNQLLQSVSDLTKESFGLYHAHIYLLDEQGENLVLAAGAGEAGRMMKVHGHAISMSRERSLVARAARTRQSVIINDVQSEAGFLPNPLLPETRAEMAVPIQVGGNVLGVLDVQSDHLNRFSHADAVVQTTLADQIAVAVQNARLYENEAHTAVQLRTVDRLKSEFLASMSHELRTPLNSIIGYAEVMLDGVDGELSPEALEDVNAIHDSGHHLLSLINDILDLAKIEAGRMDLDREKVSVAEVAEEVQRITNVLVKDKNVDIVAEVEQGLPEAYADHVRLRQILNNLVSNAIKFTEQGEVRIKARFDQKTNMLLIQVKDTGMGIAPENLNLVFEQFRQVDGSSARKASGTGMGLTITRHLVNMHGGEIWVESKPGDGSTFSFTMPVSVETENVAGD